MALKNYKNKETSNILRIMFLKWGSIKKYRTIEDFGRYRERLFNILDNEISKIKGKK